MHFKRRYKICIYSVILGQLSKLEGLQYNLTYYESEKFSDSILRHISKSENFRYPNLGSFIWGMKCEIQKIVGILLDKHRKLFIN